jgi:hypothetical protein
MCWERSDSTALKIRNVSKRLWRFSDTVNVLETWETISAGEPSDAAKAWSASLNRARLAQACCS